MEAVKKMAGVVQNQRHSVRRYESIRLGFKQESQESHSEVGKREEKEGKRGEGRRKVVKRGRKNEA